MKNNTWDYLRPCYWAYYITVKMTMEWTVLTTFSLFLTAPSEDGAAF